MDLQLLSLRKTQSAQQQGSNSDETTHTSNAFLILILIK